ncbi:MAG: fimbrillin family protein, partial [Duncaniella sp.]|nr:fimbrillin family protein [Duncaniella sp.]
YYPFTGVEGTAPGTDGKITANTRPANQQAGKQPLIDFLWDSKTGVGKKDFSASNPNVNFVFSHQMCKLTFTFLDTPSTDLKYNVEVKDITAYELLGLGFDGTFDTATGVCSINDPEANDSIKFEGLKGTVQHNVELPSIIMFPQKPGNDKVKLRLYLDELNNESQLQTYTCSLTFGDGELKPGYSYKYTIKVTKVGLIVGQMSIEDWNLDRDVRLTATIDGAFDFTDGGSGNN